MMRAAIYARVSGDDSRSDNRGIPGQLELCRNFCKEKGFTVAFELAEDARRNTSGADWDLPEINRGLNLARSKEIDAIVVREMDRLARDLGKQLFLEHEFNRAGAKVFYVLEEYDDSPSGQFLKTMRGAISQFERLKTLERTQRGRRDKVRNGGVIFGGFGPPFGYVIENGNLVIQEDDAKIVKSMFDWYTVEKITLRQISERLSKMAVNPPGRGKVKGRGNPRRDWQSSTIREILRNKTYAGFWQYNKTSECEIIEVKVPAIISLETHQAALEQLEENRRTASRNRKYQYLLAGHGTCGKCGVTVVGRHIARNNFTYACNARRTGHRYPYVCDLPYFHFKKTEAAVWEALKSLVSDPARLRQKLIDYQTEQDEVNKPIRDDLESIGNLLAKNRRKRQGWLEMRAEGEITKDELKAAKEPIDRAIADLEKRQAILQAELNQDAITTEVIDNVVKFAETVGQKLELVNDDFDEKRWLLREMRVKIRFTVEDGKRVIYVSWRLDKGEKRMVIEDNVNRCAVHNDHITLTERIVLDD